MSDEERSSVRRIGGVEFKELLNREYTLREKEAVVAVLSAIGHAEAYAWLVSAAESPMRNERRALVTRIRTRQPSHVVDDLLRAFRFAADTNELVRAGAQQPVRRAAE